MNATLAVAPGAIYPVAYGARLVGLDGNTARRWARGYAYRRNGEVRQGAPVVQLMPEGTAGRSGLTFEQLLTLRLVRAFREKGLSLPTIKRAAEVAVTQYGIQNPFVSKVFRSDGRSVFIELEASWAVPGEDRVLVNALTGQQQFRDVVEPSLFEDVVFVGDVPGQWFPLGQERSVVIRPDRVFGAPHVADTGVRTDVLADAVGAEGGGDDAIRRVAEFFRVPVEGVWDALTAEAEWRAPQAA